MDFPNINFAALKDELIRDEADKRYPYDDKTGKRVTAAKGNITIGIGRNLETKPLSDEVVEIMFTEDVVEAINELKIIFERFDKFTQTRAHALVNMMFNLGGTRFREFIHMIEAIELGDWPSAGREVKNSLYCKELPSRALRNANALING